MPDLLTVRIDQCITNLSDNLDGDGIMDWSIFAEMLFQVDTIKIIEHHIRYATESDTKIDYLYDVAVTHLAGSSSFLLESK